MYVYNTKQQVSMRQIVRTELFLASSASSS